MLHDVARTETDHATEGAAILRREGYPKVAKIIEQHHDLEVHHEKENAVEMPTETEVVYLADKLIKGTKKVSLRNVLQPAENDVKNRKMPGLLLPLISGAMMRQGK